MMEYVFRKVLDTSTPSLLQSSQPGAAPSAPAHITNIERFDVYLVERPDSGSDPISRITALKARKLSA